LPDTRARETHAERIGNRILGIIDVVEIIQDMESNAEHQARRIAVA